MRAVEIVLWLSLVVKSRELGHVTSKSFLHHEPVVAVYNTKIDRHPPSLDYGFLLLSFFSCPG